MWSYFNEGNLNILFVNEDHTKLLRLPKRNNANSTLQIYQNLSLFESFAKYFPVTTLVNTKPEWLDLHHSIKADEYALIVDNIIVGMDSKVQVAKHTIIHHNAANDKLILEFKPKWLYRCKSLNCRNCSLSYHRGKLEMNCPLKLLNKSLTSSWCNAILKETPSLLWAKARLTAVLQNDRIFHTLYKEQEEEDFQQNLQNLRDIEDVSVDLRRRMTLRDVTLFITVSKDEENYDVKMVDLDLKPAEKFRYWQKVELDLQSLYNKELGLDCNKVVNI